MDSNESFDAREKLLADQDRLEFLTKELDDYLKACSEVEKFTFLNEVMYVHSKAEKSITLGRQAEKSLRLEEHATNLIKSRVILIWAGLGGAAFVLTKMLEESLREMELVAVWLSVFVGLALLVLLGWIALISFTLVRQLIHRHLMRSAHGIEFEDALWARSGRQALDREFGVFRHDFPYNDRAIIRATEDYLIGRTADLDDAEWLNRQARYLAACLSIAHRNSEESEAWQH